MRRQCAYNISDLHFYDRMSRIYSPISCVCVSLLFFRLVVELSTGNGRNSGKRFGHSAKVIHFNRQVRRPRSVSVNQLTRRLTLGILVRNRCNPTFGLELEFDFVRKIKSRKNKKTNLKSLTVLFVSFVSFSKASSSTPKRGKTTK